MSDPQGTGSEQTPDAGLPPIPPVPLPFGSEPAAAAPAEAPAPAPASEPAAYEAADPASAPEAPAPHVTAAAGVPAAPGDPVAQGAPSAYAPPPAVFDAPPAPSAGIELAPPSVPPYAQGDLYAQQGGYPGAYGPPAGYGPPLGRRANGLAVAGFIIGLVSVFLPLFFGFVGGAVGLVLSIVGVAKHDELTQSSKGLGIAGIILSAIAIVFIL